MLKARKRIQACVFDWAGTTIDYGCIAPLQVFLEIFKNKKIPISKKEAEQFMGILKSDHIRALLNLPRVKAAYENEYGKAPEESTVKEFNKLFEQALFKVLKDYAVGLPFAFDTIDKLRQSGLKIGSTTGYTEDMMKVVSPIIEKQGYKPDYLITSSQVKKGRPFPYMIYQNALNLEVPFPDQIVKIGDSVADIKEGLNAGAWSIGVLEGSSMLGYTLEEYKSMNTKEQIQQLNKKKQECINKYLEAGADYVLNNIVELPEVIEKINEQRLANGEEPGNRCFLPSQPYTLFTPGPITLSQRVKMPMMNDWGSREFEYLDLVERVRKRLVDIATNNKPDGYTSVIMQGSGTFGVEATVTTVVPKNGKILIIENGEYGRRMTNMVRIAGKNYSSLAFDDKEVPDPNVIDKTLKDDPNITHVAFIHSETTTGILNPLKEIMQVVKQHKKIAIVDAMSSYGAIPLDVKELDIDFLVASSNKNIQGVPGFSFAIGKVDILNECKGNATTLSLDLYDQWQYLTKTKGGFRFTSPVHAIRSVDEAINELEDEGGVEARYQRYSNLQRMLVEGMKKLNFRELDLKGYQGPIITTFHSPTNKDYDFKRFYDELRVRRCVIYPGKLTKEDTFRIGTIGHIFKDDIKNLLTQIEYSIFWDNKKM